RRAAPVLAARLGGDQEAFAAAVATPFTPMPAFWSDQFELRLQAFGLPAIADEALVVDGAIDSAVVMAYLRDGTLVGVTAIGMTKQVGALRPSIGRQFDRNLAAAAT